MMNTTSIALMVLSIVALASAQCSCQSKPPIDVKYEGEACECSRRYPIQMEVPKITEHRDAHYDYGFTIERPQEPPAEVKYTFDFHMEKPKPVPTASLATYGFEVDTPVQKEAKDPQRYSFDYQIQTPVRSAGPSTLQDLFAHVDRVVVQKQDCPSEKSGCTCNIYKPTIDFLQRCPKHGHLYRDGGALSPNHPSRYTKDSHSIEHQTSDQIVAKSAERSKRNVVATTATTTFPIKIKKLLPGLRSNNQILKNVPSPSTDDHNQNRIEEIIKKNFGEDQTENIDELLRPKPLGATAKIASEVEKGQVVGDSTPDFIAKIKPKLEEAKANFRERITQIVNKARLDAIKVRLDAMKANHMVQKRSTIESKESNLPDDDVLMDENFDESFDPIWITDESVEDLDTENALNDPMNGASNEETSTNDRFRKHCDRCGELAEKFPCPSCGSSYPSEMSQNQANPIPKQSTAQPVRPRYVYDRLDGRNMENIYSQAGDEATVGSYHSQAAYGELQDILSKNSEAMYEQNRGVGDDHLIQPMNFAHAADAIRFIQELTERNNRQQNQDYYSNDDSYDVRASPQNFHAKRSFKIVPLAEKDDGSVFVKISPVKKSKSNEKSIVGTDYAKYYGDEKTIIDGKTIIKDRPSTNLKKFVRNGKKYEILALNANGSEEGTVRSEEDLEILKYIYAVNQQGQKTGNESDDVIAENEMTKPNGGAHRVET